MLRNCTKCRRPFQPEDLNRKESKHLEHDRKAAGLEGVRFLFYHCSSCGMDDVFVDVLPRPGELKEEFEQRRSAMEMVADQFRSERTEPSIDAVVVAVPGAQ